MCFLAIPLCPTVWTRFLTVRPVFIYSTNFCTFPRAHQCIPLPARLVARGGIPPLISKKLHKKFTEHAKEILAINEIASRNLSYFSF